MNPATFRPFLTIFSLAAVLLSGASAQQPAAPPTGTVAGHVICADTQRPARFAQVTLIGVPAEAAPTHADPNANVKEQTAAAFKMMNNLKMVSTQTDIDGSFSAAGANPGDYYVFASVPGYIQPSNLVEAAIEAGDDPHKSITGAPRVHVTADHASQAEVAVDRGAAISGHARWDDGTPVTRAMISLIPAKAKKKDLPPEFAMLVGINAVGGGGGLLAFTDDLGQFRISGLAPGDYVVKAVLTTHSSFAMQGGAMSLAGAMAAQSLTVFAPATFHQKDAKPVTLHAAEERTDADIAFNLSGLQTVSGSASSAEDHHRINSGSIKLEDTTDKDFTRTSALDANGAFSLTFIPPGTYTLSITGASDEAPSTKKPTGMIAFTQTDTLRSYEDAQKTIVIIDSALSNQDFDLTPSAKTTQKPDFNQLLSAPPPPPPS